MNNNERKQWHEKHKEREGMPQWYNLNHWCTLERLAWNKPAIPQKQHGQMTGLYQRPTICIPSGGERFRRHKVFHVSGVSAAGGCLNEGCFGGSHFVEDLVIFPWGCRRSGQRTTDEEGLSAAASILALPEGSWGTSWFRYPQFEDLVAFPSS